MPYPEPGAAVGADDSGKTVLVRSFTCIPDLPASVLQSSLRLFASYRSITGSTLVPYTAAFAAQDRFVVQSVFMGEGVATLADVADEWTTPPPEPVVLSIVSQVLLGMRHLHAQGLVHGCLSAKTILVLPDSTVKIADFGLAATLAPIATDYERADPQPPESSRGLFEMGSDVWMIGAVVHRLCTFQNPGVDFAQPVSGYSASLNEVRVRMLDPCAARRPTVADLLGDALIKEHLARIGRALARNQFIVIPRRVLAGGPKKPRPLSPVPRRQPPLALRERPPFRLADESERIEDSFVAAAKRRPSPRWIPPAPPAPALHPADSFLEAAPLVAPHWAPEFRDGPA